MIEGKDYVLEPWEYLVSNGVPLYDQEMKGSNSCDTVFQPFSSGDANLKIWIAGDTFMSKYLVTFDRDNDRVGFSKPDFETIKAKQDKVE